MKINKNEKRESVLFYTPIRKSLISNLTPPNVPTLLVYNIHKIRWSSLKNILL